MYENFGNASFGGLPADYGKATTQGVVGATQELPSPQAGSGQYGGRAADWLAERQARKAEEQDNDASSFWANLRGTMAGSNGEPLTPEEAAARGSAAGAGAAGFVKQALPTFLELFGPQVEEQALPTDQTDTSGNGSLTYTQPPFPWMPVAGIGIALLLGGLAIKKWGN